jgi:fibronectin type 3 domain-containing protein
MYRKASLLLTIFFVPYFITNAQNLVSGNVKGTWTKVNSPYYVADQITVQSGDTLIIEPGVQIRFQGHYMFIVNGLLKAIGTATDSILFTRDLPIEGNKWWGLRFINASDSCKLQYCIIEYGKASGRLGWPETKGGGIYCENSFPAIQNCTIRNNEAEDDGGGIDVDNPAKPDSMPLVISSCVIANNKGRVGGGGGVNATGSSLIVLKNVLIAGCTALRGGGVYTTGPLRVINCTISNNVAEQQGGGIGTLGSTVSVSNSIVFFNQAPNGGQIFIDPFFVKTLSVSYSDVQNGWSGVGNINANPLFVDIVRGDYHLQANSPCIDAGDPASPLDPDGTRADMGALYFKQTPVDQTPPAAPQGLTAIADDRQITLKWRRNTEADFLRYRIYRGTSPNPTTKVDSTNNVADTAKTFTGLTNGTTYYFRITAVDQSLNESSFSNEASATPTLIDLPPTPPKNLQATPGDKQITLKWDANTEPDLLRYRIYGGTAPNPATIVDSVLAALGTTKTLTGLSNGRTYYYRITAVDVALNASGFSNEVNAMPTGSDMPPAPPQNVRATAGDRQIALYWNRNTEPDMNSYRIYGGTSPNPQTVVDSLPFSYYDRGGNFNYSTDVTITGLINGTTYYYRMTAVDNGGNESNFSTEVSATPALPPPAAPKNLQATAGIAQVTLTWNANTEADFLRYRIYGGASANPTAQIDSAEGRATTSKTINNLAIGATYYFRLKAVNTAMQASGYSNTVTAVPLADKTAPTLANAAYTEPANLNGEVAVAIAATDASGIKNVWLYYRVGGSATFSNRLMARQNGDTYTQAIPAPAITNKGAEFYVAAEDAYGNLAQSRLYPVRVYCPAGIANPNSQPRGKEASFYRLFSIPLSLDEKSPEVFLTANSSLGVYDKAKYRWYAFERSPQALREYPNFGNVQMTPDMGFALLVNIQNVKLKTGSGTTVNTTAPYNLTLPAGWSLIGNPFHFNIPFDSLRVSKGSFELWRFEGDWQLNTAGLEPWKGYAIWLSQAATFSIRPGVAGLKSATAFYSVENNGAENWLIQISADNGRSASRFNFVGQNELANDGDDQLDLHQPVRLAGGVEVVLTKKNSASLKADIRQPSANGHTWEFTCRLNPEDEVLSLTFDGVATVPPAFDIFLIEPETATAYNLRSNPRLQFATHNLTERRFQLAAGTKAYLHEQNFTAGLQPASFTLLQNFPNPFNPATQIIYSLPEAGHVEVSVYNLRGERVATLVNERQASGSHTVVWNAEKSGSGVYFIKMRAGRVEMMKKCLFVK